MLLLADHLKSVSDGVLDDSFLPRLRRADESGSGSQRQYSDSSFATLLFSLLASLFDVRWMSDIRPCEGSDLLWCAGGCQGIYWLFSSGESMGKVNSTLSIVPVKYWKLRKTRMTTSISSEALLPFVAWLTDRRTKYL